jgi:hypothetical protein
MKLTGPQYQQLQRALLSAFPRRADLEQMLLFQLGEPLDAIAASGNLSDTVFSLIQWAVSRGRLGELIDGARSANPGNAELRAFAEPAGQAQPPPTAQPAPPLSAEREHLQELLAIQKGNLRKLEHQEALYGGLGVPLSLVNQLEEVRREIAKLTTQLNASHPPTSRRRDTYSPYETALEELLRRLGAQHARYADALIYQQRLAENIDASRRYGDSESTRAERARIVGQLNALGLDELGVAFNELM